MIDGSILVGNADRRSATLFHSVNPATGEALPQGFCEASATDVADACALANGWPTGEVVSHAMVHGGPFPSTSDGRTTSVGTLAMTRFLRPVSYQDIPDALLPPPVQSSNPLKLTRRIDSKREMV